MFLWSLSHPLKNFTVSASASADPVSVGGGNRAFSLFLEALEAAPAPALLQESSCTSGSALRYLVAVTLTMGGYLSDTLRILFLAKFHLT